MKTKNLYDLDPERLATTDEHGHRVYLYPEDVEGKWKDRRHLIYWILIVVYLVLPWFYIKGKPAILIDIVHNEFTFFGATLHGVEPVLFFLILASLLFLIGFVTSVYGRVWCGWACPQTVFIQSIFQKVEALIEGKARTRRTLDQGPLTFPKVFKKLLKWTIFTAISLHIAHTFIGYFVGPRELFYITLHSPSENFITFSATMIISLIILLDFGWFREQFCIIACPYGRMQSVIMDENSLVVAYDAKRGEPRRGTSENEGDCINCYNCVKVCPTGIDIRRGNQLECIACTNCIDACDEIMTKIKKPTGLIRYSSENELTGKVRNKLPLRSIIYISISCIFILSFAYFLNASTQLNMVFLRGRTPYQKLDEQTILNQFTVKITHQGTKEYQVQFEVVNPELKNKVSIVTPVIPYPIDSSLKKTPVFFRFHPAILASGTRSVTVKLIDSLTGKSVSTKEVVLVGPVN